MSPTSWAFCSWSSRFTSTAGITWTAASIPALIVATSPGFPSAMAAMDWSEK